MRGRKPVGIDIAGDYVDNSRMSEIMCERVEQSGEIVTVVFREPDGNIVTITIDWPQAIELGWPPVVGERFMLTRHASDHWSIETLEVT